MLALTYALAPTNVLAFSLRLCAPPDGGGEVGVDGRG